MKIQALMLTGLLTLAILGCEQGDEPTDAEGVAELTLATAPEEVTLQRGGSLDLVLTIERRNLDDKVSVDFENLPEGVTIALPDKVIVEDKQTYTIQASEDAPLVSDHQVKITVRAIDEELDDSSTFRLEITEAQ